MLPGQSYLILEAERRSRRLGPPLRFDHRQEEFNAMVEIKLDKDKFDSRIEQIIHNSIERSYGLRKTTSQIVEAEQLWQMKKRN